MLVAVSMPGRVPFAIAILAVPTFACQPTPSFVTAFQQHAARTHGCPREDVVVTSIAPNRVQVYACGHVATYSCVRHYGDRYSRGYVDECVRDVAQ